MHKQKHHCCVSRSPVLRVDIKNKNSVLHMTAVFYINCRLVSDLFEIKHARRFQIKTLFEPFMQKRRKRIDHCIPLSNICVVTETSHQKKTVPPATQFLWKSSAHAGHKKKLVWLFHANMSTCTLRDSYVLPSQQPKWLWQALCCKLPFGSNSLHSSQQAVHIHTNQTSS